MLHLTKVAVGCPDVETLTRVQQARWGNDLCLLTRFAPKRAEELIGGSLFWIIRHRLVARQVMTGFTMVDTEWGRKCRIGLAGPPIAVVGIACRAHQGWRYLAAADAPADLSAEEAALPQFMVRELGALWLI